MLPQGTSIYHFMNETTGENEQLQDLLKKIVYFARTGDYGNASSVLNAALLEIQSRIRYVAADESLLRKIGYSLETLHLMQQHDDWVAIADLVEFELSLLIEGIKEHSADKR